MKNNPSTQHQKPIKDYIPDFLEYLDSEKNLSSHTQKSYSRSLVKFIKWLSKNDMKHLKPNELTTEQISNYKTYLSNYTSRKTNKKLGKSTQHRHLVALRALLSFFKKKNINNNLNPKVIKLPNKGYLNNKENTRTLSSSEISNLLSAPDTTTTTGLRDRTILEVLFSTGLKAKELVNLNRNSMISDQNSGRLELKTHMKKNQEFKVQIPEKAATWVRRYVNTRKDDSNALFIRYKGPKSASLRLSKRSLENIIKRYAKEAEINSPDYITPEKLRNIYAKQLYKKDPPQIKDNIFNHTSVDFKQNNLQEICSTCPKKKNLSAPLSWNIVEANINKEINWLESQIAEYSSEKTSKIINCKECLLRKLATLIVAGKIKAIKINNFTLPQNYEQLPKMSTHGKEWHQEVINIMHRFLTSKGYNIIVEPVLAQGRADLEAKTKNKERIYVEIGSVSFYKLWYNLHTIQNINLLIITNKNKAIILSNNT